MSKILVLGKGGQLSNALQKLLGDTALVAGPDEASFLEPDVVQRLSRFADGQTISAVINAAAYTQVDKSEGEGLGECFRINATAVAEIAEWVSSLGIPFVHFSTDYVFNGEGDKPWTEEDTPDPQGAYGKSKLLSEVLVSNTGGRHLIFRTSWLYDESGKNFFTTMRRLMGEREELKVVADQIGAPTYVPHLARYAVSALIKATQDDGFPSGTYHVCSGGHTSWHGFATAIFEHERAKNPALRCQRVLPIPSSEYPLPAKRPLNSRLDCTLAERTFGLAMPGWRDGLEECFKALG